jgi:hypothetical protein
MLLSKLKHRYIKMLTIPFLVIFWLLPSISLSQDSITISKDSVKITSLDTITSSHPLLLYTTTFKNINDTFSVVGIQSGYTIFRNAHGDFFTINPKSGKIQVIPQEPVSTIRKASQKKKSTQLQFNREWLNVPLDTKVRLIGVDRDGNVVEENFDHKQFYLNPKTGEMIFLKK